MSNKSCAKCEKSESPAWQTNEKGEHICQDCSSTTTTSNSTADALEAANGVKDEHRLTQGGNDDLFKKTNNGETTTHLAKRKSVDDESNQSSDKIVRLEEWHGKEADVLKTATKPITKPTAIKAPLDILVMAPPVLKAVPVDVDSELTNCEPSLELNVEVAPAIEQKSKQPAAKNSPTIVRRLRKSTRSTRFRSKTTNNGGANVNNNTSNHANGGQSGVGSASTSSGGGQAAPSGKVQNKGGRSRRSIFKRPAVKTPVVQAATQFVTSVFFKNSYIQIGDIVSLVDTDRNVYYAQIRGLLVDAYCEKSAFLTWLIPTQDSPDPKDGFDPATYLIGPDEDFSRKLAFLEFVMHAPSNYYHDRTTPFPLPDSMEQDKQPGGYIWTHLPTYKRERGAQT